MENHVDYACQPNGSWRKFSWHSSSKAAVIKEMKRRLCRSADLYRVHVTPPVEGEQARDYKDSLTDVLVPQMLSSWLETVVRTANDICGEQVAMYEKGGYCGKIVVPTRKGRECLIKAIDKHMDDAPEVARKMLASYRAEMQEGVKL